MKHTRHEPATRTTPNDDANWLMQSIREFVQDARFIIGKVDEFELSLKLARQRRQPSAPDSSSAPNPAADLKERNH